MNKDEQFFYDQAGWSYDAKVETSEQGRIRCAIELAKAEVTGRSLGLEFDWRYEDEPCDCDEQNHDVEFCLAKLDGRILASLGMICGARRQYRRVVEAELAMEATEAYRAEGARVNA